MICNHDRQSFKFQGDNALSPCNGPVIIMGRVFCDNDPKILIGRRDNDPVIKVEGTMIL